MEDKPIVRLMTLRIQPEYEERFLKWQTEIYMPIYQTIPGGFKEINLCKIVKENPAYNKTLTIMYASNKSAMVSWRSDQRFRDIQRDWATWANRFQYDWYPAYEQIAIFRKESTNPDLNTILESGGSPVFHLEGYILSNEEQDRFDIWFNKFGREVFTPLLMRLPGLREYTRYRLVEVDRVGLAPHTDPRTTEYPPYLSILLFDNIKVFQNYESSLELGAFRAGIAEYFPMGLDYKWYVQYQLIKSWRK